MGKETSISWTQHTFDPWWGCTKVSPGCDHCYAEALDKRYGEPHWGKGVARRIMSDNHWRQPLLWNKAAAASGNIETVFCASMADVMDDEAPVHERARLWRLINQTPNLRWQLLTKRPQRFTRYLPKDGFRYDNVILGATTENQESYDVRMRHLDDAVIFLRQRGLMHPVQDFISYEPALGPIVMGALHPDWLIFGGESGPHHRPMEIAWAEAVKKECDYIGIPFFMKQMSARSPKEGAALIPAELLIRQLPY